MSVYNYIYTGIGIKKADLETFLQFAVEIRKLERKHFDVYGGTLIRFDDGTVIVDMNPKYLILQNQPRYKSMRARSGNDFSIPTEISLFRLAIGQMLFMGRI